MLALTRASWLRRNVIAGGISLAVALALLALHFWSERTHKLDVLAVTEAKLVDLRFQLRGRRQPSGEVVVVGIDRKSTAALGRWPWSRAVHAALIDRLIAFGATTVAFDVLFVEPEGVDAPEGLEAIAGTLPAAGEGPAEFAPIRAAVERALAKTRADGALAAAFERAYEHDAAWPVLAFDLVLEGEAERADDLGAPLTRDQEQTVLDAATYMSRDDNDRWLRTEPPRLAIGLRPPLGQLSDWAAGLGYVNPVFDRDGGLRRECMATVYSPEARAAHLGGRDVRAPLLAQTATVEALRPLAVAAVGAHLRLKASDVELDLREGAVRFPLPERLGGGERVARIDPFTGSMFIKYYGGARTVPTYSFVDVLNATLTDGRGVPVEGAEAFGGKLVFVGLSDPGLGDVFTTPFTSRLPGVEKHATVAENLLRGDFVRTHADRELSIVLTALAAAAIVALVAGNLSALAAFAVLGLVGAAWLGATFAAFRADGLLWNWTIPGLTLLLSYGAITVYRQLTEERAKRHVRSVFSTYMSPDAVAEVLSNPEKLKLGGERRDCTLFFSDLVGFTSLTESIADPQDLVALMNRYLGRMTEQILAEQGLLDKYIGDAIMAIFGVPIARPDHAARGCRAALRNMAELARLREEFVAEGLPSIDCRIGLSTGTVVVGNMGSEVRMDYTALGDTVNLASRLEGANKMYGSHIMVSERTRAEAVAHDPALLFRPLDRIAVKGKDEPVDVFELYGVRDAVSPQTIETVACYEQGIHHYRKRDFEAALERFEAALSCDPEDGPSRLYRERCQVFLDEPPPADWDGVFRMQTK